MNTPGPTAAAHAPGHEHNDMAHVATTKLLIVIFVLLVFFTFLTVWLNKSFHFAGGEVWIAMGIGTVKATLVGLYFMHLRYDRAFNIVVFLSAFLFVSIFISFALMDSDQYQGSITWEERNPHLVAPAGSATPAAPAAPAK